MSRSFSLHEYFRNQKLGIISESVNEEDYDRERDAQAMGYPSAAAADADNWGRPKEGVQDEMLDTAPQAQDPTQVNPVTDQDHNEYLKFETVEDLMKEIERSTDEAALKHKMERVKAAYEALEQKAVALEEGDNAEFVSKSKVKEMKHNSKKLRKMYEKYEKVYEKKYNKDSKKSVKKEKAYESVTSFTLREIIKEEIRQQPKKD